ncbi:methyl-accepting chemotaxis protein [Maridesulfovibrio sp.]|uniref:methyl-accepting chemotaxis protein n=1 Tax=Maridesulfovibrio sp. TaxID=2795000 RepID=UPI003BA8CB40
MKIRTRMILAIVLPMIISVAVVMFTVSMQFDSTAEDSYRKTASQELKLINNYIAEILKKAENVSRFVAGLDETKSAMGRWTKYFELDGSSKPAQYATDETEIMVNRLANNLMKANPAFAYVYLGFEDGGYTQDGTDTLKNDYDPRKRPWYKQGKNSPNESTLLSAYMTTEGFPNIGMVTKIKDKSGSFIGVSAVDISLGDLTKIINNLKIGETGFVVLVQGDGTILADPKTLDNNFKKIDEVDNAALKTAYYSKTDWIESLEFNGAKFSAEVHRSKETGWSMIAFIPHAEIYAASKEANLTMLTIAAVAAIVFGLLGAFLVNSRLVRPIHAMGEFAKQIASGNYKAKPEDVSYKAELRDLLDNLQSMTGELVETISLADEKTREAEEKTLQAEDALAEAEEATRKAETAKRDGMMQAAGQLEEIVERISSSSTELSANIEESRGGSEMQRERAAENATAMEEMNATVLEVAANASKSSEEAERARKEAVHGSEIVDKVVTAVSNLKAESEKLGSEMGQLGEKAESISSVMSVITDIADQTNLLALNAAIEAARAGEAGRGFAVVADEVRKLAEKTVSATSEVGEAIGSIQQSSRNSINTMTETSEMVDSTTTLVNEAGGALKSILDIIELVAEQVRSIATAAEQQSAASEEINMSTSEINRIADENFNAMEQSADAMANLAELSNMLNNLIEELKRS